MRIESMWKMIVLGAAMLLIYIGGAIAKQTPQSCDVTQPETTPTNRYTLNVIDGTAVDRKTNLTWKLCLEGVLYENSKCEGKSTKYMWDHAMKKFGDKGDGWRLPNADELNSIVEMRCLNPSINQEVFPYGGGDLHTLTSTEYFETNELLSKLTWTTIFFGSKPGEEAWNAKFLTYPVRLVRGEPWFDPAGKVAKETRKLELRKTEANRQDAERKRQTEFYEAERKQLEQRAMAFRKSLQTGDESNCGLVIEVKRPIVKIQNASGERWLKVEQLYPQGSQSCGQVAGEAPAANPASNRLVGTRVCRVFTGIMHQITGLGYCGPQCTIGLSSCSGRIAVSGVVERVVGEKSQIRIGNAHVEEMPRCYAPFQANEGPIEKSSVIWDQAANWSGC